MNDNQLKKRICFLSVVHPLLDHRFFYKEAPALAENGYDVILAFPFIEKSMDLKQKKFQIVPLFPPRSRCKRFFYSLTLLPKMLNLKADIYHFVDVELLPLGFLMKLARKSVIYDAHEDVVSFMMHKTYIPKPFRLCMSYLVKIIENFSDLWLDGLVFADEGTSDQHRWISKSRKLVYYNFPLKANFPKRVDLPKPQDRKYDFCFLGTMTETSGTFILLKGLAKVSNSGRRFLALFIGQPEPLILERMNDFIEKNQLQGMIEITGRIPHDKVPDLLKQCRIGLIGLPDLPKFRRNIPTKLFEYWACGLSVAMPDLPPTRPIFKCDRHGRLFCPGNSDDLAAKLIDLLDHPENLSKISEACRDDFDSIYYGESQQKKLVEFYNGLFGGPQK
jgi:glycosyltransferase involved in cell wall biosynthesis